MLRKLELDALRADLAAVTAMVESRSELADPIGFMQFRGRQKELERKVTELGNVPDLTAGIAVFFGGSPVKGSRGIQADFAGKALENFQDIVAKQYAAQELEVIGQRGPAPLRSNSALMITDVARGSIGFVLEEIQQDGTLFETKLRKVVHDVVVEIVALASPNVEQFDAVLEALDTRQLTALRNFFRLLDEQRATLRLVDSDSDASLDANAVHRARERTDAINIAERETTDIAGRLYLLPAHRKFEIVRSDTGETIYGNVSAEYTTQLLETLNRGNDLVGRNWRTRMLVREVQRPNGTPKTVYTLLGLTEEIQGS